MSDRLTDKQIDEVLRDYTYRLAREVKDLRAAEAQRRAFEDARRAIRRMLPHG